MFQADYGGESPGWSEARVDCRDLLATIRLRAKASNAGKLQKKKEIMQMSCLELCCRSAWIWGSDGLSISWAVRAANCSHCVATDCAFGARGRVATVNWVGWKFFRGEQNMPHLCYSPDISKYSSGIFACAEMCESDSQPLKTRANWFWFCVGKSVELKCWWLSNLFLLIYKSCSSRLGVWFQTGRHSVWSSDQKLAANPLIVVWLTFLID